MTLSFSILAGTAFLIGLIHTVLGPDHYLPFIALSRSRNWSVKKTLLITLVCGTGHVLSSIILGAIGITFGIAVTQLENIEAYRGEIAAWLLFVFGITYLIWGIHRAVKNKPHRHMHNHGDGTEHVHEHTHNDKHTHIHESGRKKLTPWILFIIFIFGPCEAFIPLLMFPAFDANIMTMIAITLIFSITTIATMMAIVTLSYYGLSRLKNPRIERFGHPTAGAVLVLCGAAILFIGL